MATAELGSATRGCVVALESGDGRGGDAGRRATPPRFFSVPRNQWRPGLKGLFWTWRVHVVEQQRGNAESQSDFVLTRTLFSGQRRPVADPPARPNLMKTCLWRQIGWNLEIKETRLTFMGTLPNGTISYYEEVIKVVPVPSKRDGPEE